MASAQQAGNPQDARFSDTFLIISPGITIRDRLRVLLPNDPNNYYRLRNIVPGHQLEKLGQARMVITNFHAFQLREKISAGKLTKALLSQGVPGVFTESPDQMVRRVCRELGTKKNIIIINDEAHHCYRRKPEAAEGEAEALTGDDRKEAEKREEEARIWISGIEAVKAKIGVKTIYDLSATPFFLRGSGYAEGTLFPWVVSDFSLIDAIEAGIVKVPACRSPTIRCEAISPPIATFGCAFVNTCRAKAEKPRRSMKSPSYPPSSKGPFKASTATTRNITNYGRPMPTPRPKGSRRRFSSSSATTPTFPSSSSITSQAGRKRPRMAKRSWSLAGCRSSTTSTMGTGARGPTRSWSTASSLNPAKG